MVESTTKSIMEEDTRDTAMGTTSVTSIDIMEDIIVRNTQKTEVEKNEEKRD